MLYRLTDEYSLFFLTFIESKTHEGSGTWHHLSQTQSYKTWRGYAFESICIKHLPQIKKAMSIAGIYAQSSSFFQKGTKEKQSAQIDLLLDRNDRVINLFEIKFSASPYTITKKYAEELRLKMDVFRDFAKTNKRLSWVFISTFGLKQNENSTGLIDHELTTEDLFAD